MKNLTTALLTCAVLAGCQSTGGTKPPVEVQNDLLNAVVWTQTAAEADALRIQTFTLAGRAMDLALADPTWTAADEQTGDFGSLPPAVIVDVDETVLDNSALEARFVRQGTSFNRTLWRGWVEERRARPLPGALEFANAAKARGVTIFYVTNRTIEEEPATRDNLVSTGFPVASEQDVILTKGENGAPSDKSSRRAIVASTHRILLLLGDDLGDFTSKEGTVDQRRERVDRNRNRWGTRWFVLPNSMYGSWESALTAGPSGESPHAVKIDALDEDLD